MTFWGKYLCLKKLWIASFCWLITSINIVSGAEVAPYFYLWGYGSNEYAVRNIAEAKAAGAKSITLAFGTAEGGCALNSDMARIMREPFTSEIQRFRVDGSHIILSFGGAAGTYLEAACTPARMAGIIKELMLKTQIYLLDFDIEGTQLENAALNDKRNQAILALQREFPSLYVSFTLPVAPSGIPESAVRLLQSAIRAGITISMVNLMTMDYGSQVSAGRGMGQLATAALLATHAQLKRLYPNYADVRIWRMLGATPMIGNNDVQSEVFTLSDAQILADFAKEKNLGLLSYWALQRDQPGNGSLGTFSGTNSQKFQYLAIFSGATSTTSTIFTTPASGTGSGISSGSSFLSLNAAPPASWSATDSSACRLWEEGEAFRVGNVVSYMGSTYTSLRNHTAGKEIQWNPVMATSHWRHGGSCSTTGENSTSSGNAYPTEKAIPCRSWREGVVYRVGNVVAYQQINYTALRTHPNPIGANLNPAATPSVWQKGGICGRPKPAYALLAASSGSSSSSSSSSPGIFSGSSNSSSENVTTGSYAAEKKLCLDTINHYRSTKGLRALTWSTELEQFADKGARYDMQYKVPHGHFGKFVQEILTGKVAENAIPAWPLAGRNVAIVVRDGTKMMWEEGPGHGPAHGHYMTMIGDYTEVGCGMHVEGGRVWINQEFRRR